MEKLTIQLLAPTARLPQRANSTDACFDLYASRATEIPAQATGLVNLDLALQLAPGWEAQVRGRSGLALKGILVHSGTIDHLYRQEIKVIVHNLSKAVFPVQPGDRIAQLAFARVLPVEFVFGRSDFERARRIRFNRLLRP